MLRRDRTVFSWPVLSAEFASDIPAGLQDVVAVAAGGGHSLALPRSGTVFGWGANDSGQATGVPTTGFPNQATGLVVVARQTLTNVVGIAGKTSQGVAGENRL